MNNLLDNAIKYTKEGGILISCRQRENDVLLQVWDTGCGIEASQLDTIFDDYVQLKHKSHIREGIGLGLAIVKKILELHNATIQVQSKVNEGAAFMFKLPVYSN